MKSENFDILVTVFLRKLQVNNYDEDTVKHYQRHIGYFLEYMERYHKIKNTGELTRPMLRSFVMYMKKQKNKQTNEPLTEYTVSRILGHIKTFLGFLTQDGYLYLAYADLLKIKIKKEAIITNILNESQIKKAMELPNKNTYLGFRDKVIFELMYNTGIRRSEVCNLEIYDLNFEEKTIFVRQGKGKKDRLVPMGDYLVKYLREYIDKVRPVIMEEYHQEKLFMHNRKKPMSKHALTGLIQKYSIQSGLEFSCHTFRHSMATHLLKHGANIVHIQKILGHNSLNTTQIYTKVYPKDLKKIISLLHPRNTKKLAQEKIEIPTRSQNYDLLKAKDVIKKKKEKRQNC